MVTNNIDIYNHIVIDTTALRKERDSLKYYKERQADFWEWYEKTYDVSNDELWKEFESYESGQEELSSPEAWSGGFADNH